MNEFIEWVNKQIEDLTAIGFLALLTLIFLACGVFGLCIVALVNELYLAASLLFPGIPALIIWVAYQRRKP